jgi:hypothetical protein
VDSESLDEQELRIYKLVELATLLARRTKSGEIDEQKAVTAFAVATMDKGKEPQLRAARRSLYEDRQRHSDYLMAASLCDQAIVLRRALWVHVRARQLIKENVVQQLGNEPVCWVLIAAARGETEDITSMSSPRQSATSIWQTADRREIGDDISVNEVLRLAELKAPSMAGAAYAQKVGALCARALAYFIAHPDA